MPNSSQFIIDSILEEWRNDPKSVVFLTGAGLSVSARVPLWMDVKKDLYKDLFDIDDPDKVEKEYLYQKFSDEEWFKNNVLTGDEKNYAKEISEKIRKLRNDNKPLPPELILSFFKKQYGIIELQNFLARHYETNELSASYISLIKLAKLGFLKFYITLNQDGLFERYLERNMSFIRFLSLTSKEDFDLFVKENENIEADTFIERERLVIANLHGVFHKPLTIELSPKVLIEPLNKSDSRYKFLKIALDSAKKLIIIGYRASDLDILGALEELLCARTLDMIWVSPSGDIPEEILQSEKLQQYGKTGVANTADEFLSHVTSKADKIRLSLTIPKPQNNHELICSAPGSVIVMGDYGVYINGKMVQLQIPLRIYAIRSSKVPKEKDCSYYYDPYIGKWKSEGNSTIEKIRKMVEHIKNGRYDDFKEQAPTTSLEVVQIFDSKLPYPIEKILEEVRSEILKRNCDLEKFSITIYSQFPTGSGAGDTLPSVVLAAIFLPDNTTEVKLEELSYEDKAFLVKLSKLYTWLYTYSNASHLRILPTFWNKSPLFILDKTEAEKKAFEELKINHNKNFNTREYIQMNLLIDTYSILESGEGIELSGSDHNNLDFIIAYYPRRAILSEEIEVRTTTAKGVYAINYCKEKSILTGLSNYTEAIIDSIKTKDYIRMGKIMSAGHFGLVSLLRGSRLVNELVGVLNGLRGIYGAKTSGAGPAGALLITYNPKEVDFRKLQSVLETYQHKIICCDVLSEYKRH